MVMRAKTKKELNVGAMVRFSREHAQRPGLDYTTDWIGVIITTTTGAPDLDPGLTPAEQHFARDWDELEIAWTIHNGIHIMSYDEKWWNNLEYEPFEVISENR